MIFPKFSQPLTLESAEMYISMTELKEAYCKQGYLSAIPILDETELSQAREAFADLEGEFGKDYTQYSLHDVHLQYDWVMRLAKHPRLLQVINACLGPDVLLLDSSFICKYPISKQAGGDIIPLVGEEQEVKTKEKETGLPYVAWHQDMRSWGIAGGSVLSVCLALDDSQRDNGALHVIPGSHFSGFLPHHLVRRAGNMLSVNQEIPLELVQTENALLCPLLAGQMTIHNGMLVHGRDPNISQRRCCGFVIRYVPTCAYPIQDPDCPRSFNATMLATGTDQYHHFSNSALIKLA